MSDNSLITVSDGQVIAASHINQSKIAMGGDIIPRDSSGVPSSGTGDLGTETYKFKDIHLSGNAYMDGLIGFIPSGLVCPYAGSANPNGWLLCNGATIGGVSSGATYENVLYEALFNIVKLTFGNAGTEIFANGDTVSLPDTRGYFVRSWDNSRGIDSGRALGDIQTDKTKMPDTAFVNAAQEAHRHRQTNWDGVAGGKVDSIYSDDILGTSGGLTSSLVAGGEQRQFSDSTFELNTNLAGGHNHVLSGGDAETRGKNLSLNYIIKI